MVFLRSALRVLGPLASLRSPQGARLAAAALLCGVCAAAWGQADLTGPGQYPQFRTLSGLSGGGFGVRPNGEIGFDGAMAFSTPIGYSMTGWRFAFGGANTSDYGFFRFPHLTRRNGSVDSIGKLSGAMGIPLGKFGSLTASGMVVSSALDFEANFQYQPPISYRGAGVSFGVQDVAGNRGDRAEDLPGARSSRSFFGVATVPFPHGVYASVGWGDRRFGKGFANVSAQLGPRWKLVLEHDGYNFNEALAFDLRALGGRRLAGRGTSSTLMVGFVRSKYAFWSVNLAF